MTVDVPKLLLTSCQIFAYIELLIILRLLGKFEATNVVPGVAKALAIVKTAIQVLYFIREIFEKVTSQYTGSVIVSCTRLFKVFHLAQTPL